MNSNNLFKYIFALVVVFLIGYTVYVIFQNKTDMSDYSLDQTSTLNNIQTDLRLAIAGLDTINPLLTNNRNVQEITKIIYEPLITLNENYKLEYCLAEEIAKTDEVNYIIKLRKGVLWSNNSNFTAYDVKYTLDLIREQNVSPIYGDNLRDLANVEVIDSNTIKLTLTHEVPFFEYNLTFPIMCESYYEGEDFRTSEKVPIGTGMFKISEFSSNVIKLVRNETYWDSNKKPMVTDVNINLYGTMGEVYAAFKNGEIDILSVKIGNVEDYIGTLGYNKIEYKSRNYDFLAFNTQNEILSDPQVRKALSLAIDKNNIVATCLGSGYVSTNFNLDMGCWLYTRDLNIQIDTEQAAQILANDGWTRTSNAWQKNIDGKNKRLEFSLSVNSNDQKRVAVAENIKSQFASFGVNVNLKYLSYDAYADAINNNNYECILTGITNGYSPSVNSFFGYGNLANYYNEEVNDIMNVIKNTTDDNELYEKYARLYEIYLEEAPYMGLYRNTDITVYNQSLVGNISANSFNVYHNIEKWYRQ